MSSESILVIDDDKITRDVLRALLGSEGFIVSCCEDGISAIDWIKKKSFEIVITDYKMPEMNGDEVTRVVRHHCPDAFIIGFSIDVKDQAFIRAGANVFISKHDLAQKLIPVINDRIRHRRALESPDRLQPRRRNHGTTP